MIKVEVTQSCPTLCDPMNCIDSPLEWIVEFPSPRDLPNPGIKPRSLPLQVDSLLSEPPGKSKNTGVGGLSLLQGIFLTQESNWSPALRWILYLLSYQGSP